MNKNIYLWVSIVKTLMQFVLDGILEYLQISNKNKLHWSTFIEGNQIPEMLVMHPRSSETVFDFVVKQRETFPFPRVLTYWNSPFWKTINSKLLILSSQLMCTLQQVFSQLQQYFQQKTKLCNFPSPSRRAFTNFALFNYELQSLSMTSTQTYFISKSLIKMSIILGFWVVMDFIFKHAGFHFNS